MLHGLTENHERSLLASIQYAARLIRDCDDVLAGASGSDPLSRYTKALSAPQEKIAHDYLFRLREQLLRALHAVGIPPPPPSIGAVHALSTALMFLDDTFEEMRGRYLCGYGDVPEEAERVLDGVVSEMQELTRDFETFLTGVSDDVLRERLERLAPANPVANDLRELSRIIAEHGLVDLRASLAVLVDRALEDTFDVAVIGRASSGKSSLLNALLGAAILPTGVLPVTAFPTREGSGTTNSEDPRDQCARAPQPAPPDARLVGSRNASRAAVFSDAAAPRRHGGAPINSSVVPQTRLRTRPARGRTPKADCRDRGSSDSPSCGR